MVKIMSFPSPQELAQRKAAKFLESSIERARAHAEQVLERGHIYNSIDIEFHSTPFEAVEVVVQELKASGWTVLSARINRGYFTHYLTVKYNL